MWGSTHDYLAGVELFGYPCVVGFCRGSIDVFRGKVTSATYMDDSVLLQWAYAHTMWYQVLWSVPDEDNWTNTAIVDDSDAETMLPNCIEAV